MVKTTKKTLLSILLPMLLLLTACQPAPHASVPEPDRAVPFTCATGYLKVENGIPTELSEEEFLRLLYEPETLFRAGPLSFSTHTSGQTVTNLYSSLSATKQVSVTAVSGIYDVRFAQMVSDMEGTESLRSFTQVYSPASVGDSVAPDTLSTWQAEAFQKGVMEILPWQTEPTSGHTPLIQFVLPAVLPADARYLYVSFIPRLIQISGALETSFSTGCDTCTTVTDMTCSTAAFGAGDGLYYLVYVEDPNSYPQR